MVVLGCLLFKGSGIVRVGFKRTYCTPILSVFIEVEEDVTSVGNGIVEGPKPVVARFQCVDDFLCRHSHITHCLIHLLEDGTKLVDVVFTVAEILRYPNQCKNTCYLVGRGITDVLVQNLCITTVRKLELARGQFIDDVVKLVVVVHDDFLAGRTQTVFKRERLGVYRDNLFARQVAYHPCKLAVHTDTFMQGVASIQTGDRCKEDGGGFYVWQIILDLKPFTKRGHIFQLPEILFGVSDGIINKPISKHDAGHHVIIFACGVEAPKFHRAPDKVRGDIYKEPRKSFL